jgi:homocysteine S-methyltransferase
MTTPNPLTPFLADGGHLVLDGALATELERRGADLKDPLWSARVLLEQPALIEAVHRDYFEAGADVATTASYQASFEGFAARGLSPDEAAALMRRAVELAVRARDAFWSDWGAPAGETLWRGRRRPLVAASVGPWGAMKADGSEYRGYAGTGMDVAALMDFHRPRLAVLARTGADLLACETLPGLDEGLALARLIDELRTQPGLAGLGGWFAFSCRDAAHVSQGERFADVAAALSGFAGVWALGVNCSAPAHVGALLAAARAVSDVPLLAYPNAGETWDAVAKVWRGDAHAPTLADHAAAWGAAGAVMLGGCCRTTPADIAALRARWPRGD